MGLYLENGYCNIPWIMSQGATFNFIIGGRGTGKTYGALQYIINNKIIFMLMRRTQAQTDFINKPEFSPFKALQMDNAGLHIGVDSISKYNAAYYNMVQDGESWKNTGAPLGYTCALSTISNMRGFDVSDVTLLLYDEFIPEQHQRPLKNEGAAFANAYETMNRNRELQGKQPLRVLCLANANDLANPLFEFFGIISKVERMARRGQEWMLDNKRGISVAMLQDSPISKRKAQSALYSAVDNAEFTGMALRNIFAQEDVELVQSKDIRQYVPVVTMGKITVYKHKSDSAYYICRHPSGTVPIYADTEADRRRAMLEYPYINTAYIRKRVLFEDRQSLIYFHEIF